MLGRIAKVMILTVAVMAVAASGLMAQTPNTISYQGRLTNAAGQPITATTSVVFSIYVAASGGTALYTETADITPDANGIFTEELGPITPGTFDGTKRYLGIKAGLDAEMTPRQLLTSAPYAFNTNSIADNAITSAKIADGAVGTADIATGGVGNADLAADAVTTDKIAAGAVGNTDLAANAVDATKVADGSLTAADLQNEPGFSYDDSGDANTLIPITASGQSFASVTLNAPAAGYALVVGSLKPFLSHVNGQWDNLIAKISTTSGDVSTPSFATAIFRLPAELPTNGMTYNVPLEICHVFPVIAGNNIFYLNAYMSSGATSGTDNLTSAKIFAIYLPTVYGTIPASAAPGDPNKPDVEVSPLTPADH